MRDGMPPVICDWRVGPQMGQRMIRIGQRPLAFITVAGPVDPLGEADRWLALDEARRHRKPRAKPAKRSMPRPRTVPYPTIIKSATARRERRRKGRP